MVQTPNSYPRIISLPPIPSHPGQVGREICVKWSDRTLFSMFGETLIYIWGRRIVTLFLAAANNKSGGEHTAVCM